ncbi:MAG: isoprenylcysteine carboxylmethyltransferase family protein [Hyphomicrobium sp.]
MPRLLKQTLIWTLILGAILFISAGTIAWPEAWVLLIAGNVLGLASALLLARHDPALLRERMRGPIQKDQKPWDKVLLVVVFALCFALPVAAGIDAVRLQASHMPVWLEALGALSLAFGIYIFHVVMITNTYASAVVRVQSERGHQVISTGPYAYVRHPMYAGAIFYFLGFALLLGSWWAVAIAAVIVVIFGFRAVWEEETLKAELEGYAAYAERVRFRLIPGVW